MFIWTPLVGSVVAVDRRRDGPRQQDYMSHLACEHLRVLQEELERGAEEMDGL